MYYVVGDICFLQDGAILHNYEVPRSVTLYLFLFELPVCPCMIIVFVYFGYQLS